MTDSVAHDHGLLCTHTDTIPGRQCMASFFYLRGEFENVMVYLSSIKVKFSHTHTYILPFTLCALLQGFFFNDDNFNFNYAQAKAALGHFIEAEEVIRIVA